MQLLHGDRQKAISYILDAGKTNHIATCKQFYTYKVRREEHFSLKLSLVADKEVNSQMRFILRDWCLFFYF